MASKQLDGISFEEKLAITLQSSNEAMNIAACEIYRLRQQIQDLKSERDRIAKALDRLGEAVHLLKKFEHACRSHRNNISDS